MQKTLKYTLYRLKNAVKSTFVALRKIEKWQNGAKMGQIVFKVVRPLTRFRCRALSFFL